MKRDKIFFTNYANAWLQFRKSDEYKRVWTILSKTGIKQRYANNILRVAFDSGWGDKKIFPITT